MTRIGSSSASDIARLTVTTKKYGPRMTVSEYKQLSEKPKSHKVTRKRVTRKK